jgi:glucose/mannose-6-phosphate isomerase
MSILDDLEAVEKLDSLRVLATVERLAHQVREGWEIGNAPRELPSGEGLESILVLGMGGSGISGDITRVLIEPRLHLPYRVVKGYPPLPEWIGRNTLVLAISYSGNTEETLAALEECLERGSRIVTVSAGGEMARLAQQRGFAHIGLPPGNQPRASLGYLLIPVLATLWRIGVIPPVELDVLETVDVLEELGQLCYRGVPAADNPAKRLADRVARLVPLIYGGEGIGAVAAYRFKCDLNEYAKAPAFSNVLPEMNHNEICSLDAMPDRARSQFAAVFVRDLEEHPQVARRIEVTKRIFSGKVARVVEVPARGRSTLARLMSLVFVTQLAAIYTGISYGVDPGPVEAIESLKAELAS